MKRIYTNDELSAILFKDNSWLSFNEKLFQLIAKADMENLENLYKGFPDQVNEYCYYAYGTTYADFNAKRISEMEV